jgi:TetR/AcrR family transcriptional regulator, transcriptional repressor for nem operon
MPKPSKRDQLVEATKELLWEVGYEAMSPRDIQARSAAKPGSLMAAVGRLVRQRECSYPR